MESHAYPPTGRFWQLTPAERATRLDVAADLLNILQFWRGDPRLITQTANGLPPLAVWGAKAGW